MKEKVPEHIVEAGHSLPLSFKGDIGTPNLSKTTSDRVNEQASLTGGKVTNLIIVTCNPVGLLC